MHMHGAVDRGHSFKRFLRQSGAVPGSRAGPNPASQPSSPRSSSRLRAANMDGCARPKELDLERYDLPRLDDYMAKKNGALSA